MVRTLVALTVALAGSAAVAQANDPLQSPPCRQAMQALQAQETAAAARPPRGGQAPDPRLAMARRGAALACLGGRGDPPPPPQRFAQPPMAVTPALVARPEPVPVPAPRIDPIRPPPVTQPAPPLLVMSCDAVGCWASDGTRLNRWGPDLLGPRGVCSVQGPLLLCP